MAAAPTPCPEGTPGWVFPRVIGQIKGGAGPVVVVVGGMHGNEPAGAFAGQDVVTEIERRGLTLAGELLVLSGNRAAMALDARFQVSDLNRRWTRARVTALDAQDPAQDDAEDAEQRELLAHLRHAEARAPLGLVVLDLHTTSGAGPPFVIMSDTLRNRRVAFALPIATILGLEETIDGTLLTYASEQGHVGLGVETGQHRDALSRHLHRSVIWVSLVSTGVLRAEQVPDLATHQQALRTAAGGAPRVVELLCRHGVTPADQFVMRPGYSGFQPVAEGEHLADSATGPVLSPTDGLILMPLYQPQGSDGFFLVRRVRPVWLTLGAWLRRARLHWVLPLLPGVSRHPDRADTLLVDPRIARLWVRQVFHLLGYRKAREEDGRQVFTRRTARARLTGP